MKRKKHGALKKVRVIVSLFFFAAISLLFIEPRNSLPQFIYSFFASLQLIPASMKIVLGIGVSSLGLFIIVGLTIAFGRVYCSSVCPLGTFQDLIIHWTGRRHAPRGTSSFRKPPYALHYALLLATGVLMVSGSLTILNLLEPFSNYGRMLTSLVDPLAASLNNLAAGVLGRFQVYTVFEVPIKRIGAGTAAASSAFLILIAYLSYAHGRFFCNSLCPAGALLGLMSRISLYRIAINGNSCNGCGACEQVCKAHCIDSDSRQIHTGACINCFNCIQSCPRDGIGYTRARKTTGSEPESGQMVHDPDRRRFFRTISIPSLAFILPGLVQKDTVTVRMERDRRGAPPIVPPGAIGIERFTNLCTACHLCISGCPTNVLYPSFLEFGFAGIFQPKMDYETSYCTYDCIRCSEICPTGAISPLTVEGKKTIQIGKASFIRDDCVVVRLKKDCAACSEHCPTKAVHMVPYEGKLSIPELDNDICVGCGACEHSCPTTPRKAIYVNSNPIHLVAKKPPVKKQDAVPDGGKDFPF